MGVKDLAAKQGIIIIEGRILADCFCLPWRPALTLSKHSGLDPPSSDGYSRTETGLVFSTSLELVRNSDPVPLH